MTAGEPHNVTESGRIRPAPATERLRDCLPHIIILTAVSLLIGAYLIATTILISRDGIFYISQAQKAGADVVGVAQRYPPAYPMLLLAAHGLARPLAGGDTTAAWVFSSQIVTLLCKTLALIVLFFVGRRLVGSRRSLLAVLILCFLPYAAQLGSDVLREWPLLLVIASGLWLLFWAMAQRKWWAFGLVGLLAGAGYWLHPACAQLALYALLGALLVSHQARSRLKLAGAVLILTAGLVFAAAPLMLVTGRILPQQLQNERSPRPDVILSVAGRPAGLDPIQVSAREGEGLELPIEVLQTDDDAPTFSGVLIPAGSRPVYSFHCPANGACFWTISEREKDMLLADYSDRIWVYDGIACYAYAKADDAPRLQPVYRLWSSGQGRHFYTTDRLQRDAMVRGSAGGPWKSEGAVFYVPAEATRPKEAVPVYRLRSGEQEYSWSVDREGRQARGTGVVHDGIAWYAFTGQPLPAGTRFSYETFQWRPESDQAGQYQINLIVSSRHFDTCQLVQIDVQKAHSGERRERTASAPPVKTLNPPSKGHESVALRSAKAVNGIFAGVTENLMVFFAVPLVLGLVYRWRHGSSRQERFVVPAILVVNTVMMFTRYVWIEPTSLRRYSLPIVALTVFYVPVGLELMAQWLARRWGRTEPFWLYVLTAIGLAICLPKLVRPLGAGKEDYRFLAQWLRDNTSVEATVAVPDQRIAFYGDRRGLVYERRPDPRNVDYIVATLSEDGRGGLPGAWRKIYTPPNQKRSRNQFVIYSKPVTQATVPAG